MTPEERANKVREWIACNTVSYSTFASPGERYIVADGLVPPGSIILTPDEAKTVRVVLAFAGLHDDHPSVDESIALLGSEV